MGTFLRMRTLVKLELFDGLRRRFTGLIKLHCAHEGLRSDILFPHYLITHYTCFHFVTHIQQGRKTHLPGSQCKLGAMYMSLPCTDETEECIMDGDGFVTPPNRAAHFHAH